jgi:hypothetical protein
MAPMRIAIVALCLVTLAAACEKRPRNRPLPPDTGLTGGDLLFEEDFQEGLANWTAESKLWRIVDGRLYTGDKPIQNKGIWLNGITLPENVRIEFEATSVKGNLKEFEGDIKFEFGGDRPEHSAGYIIIFGGWKNSLNTIARGDEHGDGRLAIDTQFKVKEGETYSFKVIRMQGEIKWFLGDKLVLRVQDPDPALGGAFGFNNWNSRVYYDKLRIYAL